MLSHTEPSESLSNLARGRPQPEDLGNTISHHETNHPYDLNWGILSLPAYQTTLQGRDWYYSDMPQPLQWSSSSICAGTSGGISDQSTLERPSASYPRHWPERSRGYSMPDLSESTSGACATLSNAESTAPSSPESPTRGGLDVPPIPKMPQAVAYSAPTRLGRRKSDGYDLRAQYPCDFCSVRMSRLHDINRHMRLHTNEKPYECLGCGQTFRRTDARARHWTKQESCLTAHRIREPAGARSRQRISLRVQYDSTTVATSNGVR